MEADFKIVVITPENIVRDEAARISTMLETNVAWRVHIRHPHAEMAEIENLLSEIPMHLYDRISLHDFYCLADKYQGLGVHLNSRNADSVIPRRGAISKSCHSISEICKSNFDYVTLSPIFDSISKEGYHSAFDLCDKHLRNALSDNKVIALGGVKPEYFDQLKNAGFAGAALLGYVWCEDDSEFDKRLKMISKYAAIYN